MPPSHFLISNHLAGKRRRTSSIRERCAQGGDAALSGVRLGGTRSGPTRGSVRISLERAAVHLPRAPDHYRPAPPAPESSATGKPARYPVTLFTSLARYAKRNGNFVLVRFRQL
jgi:hypothetical protein